MKTLEDKQQARLLYLKTLYDKTRGGSRGIELDMWELGKELGFSHDDTSDVVDYLAGERLLADDCTLSGVSLSHAGVVEIEVRKALPQLSLGDDDLADAEANLVTLEAQAKARRPDPTILGRAVSSIRGLLEAAAKGAATAAGTVLMQNLIASIPTVLVALR